MKQIFTFDFLACRLMFAVISICISAGAAQAGEAEGEHELEFSRPLITTYPTIENELRLSYSFENKPGEEGKENEIEAEIEYEFVDGMAIELEAPFVFINPDHGDSEQAFDNLEVALKISNPLLEKYDVGMAYGLGVSLPTGDEDKGIGTENLVFLEPFYTVGYKLGSAEVIASANLEIPLNPDDDEEDATELEYSTAILHELFEEFKIFVEFDGGVSLNGDEQGKPVVNVSPGLKTELVDDLELAVSIGFPLTDEKEFHTRALAALFWEF